MTPMDMTPRLKLPYIAPQQAQKQVTYNEAMRALDTLVHPVVKSRTLAAPPGSPAEGDAYLVAASPTGGWAGKAGKLAVFVDGGWLFHAPLDGWLLYVEADDQFVQRQAGVWTPLLASVHDLSDYAEGTWSPGISFGGNAVGVAYGAGNAGRYTRIGRLCIATFLLQVTNKGSSTGVAALTGLPFAALGTSPPGALTVGWITNITIVSGSLLGAVAAGGTTAALYGSGSGTAAAITHSAFSGSSQLQGVVTYEAA
jgi:hypothetical protein